MLRSCGFLRSHQLLGKSSVQARGGMFPSSGYQGQIPQSINSLKVLPLRGSLGGVRKQIAYQRYKPRRHSRVMCVLPMV